MCGGRVTGFRPRLPRSAETPIEREIRLAKEREDERRREQAMVASRHTMAAVFEEKPATVSTGPSNTMDW